MEHHYSYFSIPIELAYWAITNKKSRTVQVYIALKSLCDGKLTVDIELQKGIAALIGIKSRQTIRSHINLLLDYNWIGYNEKSKNYFIRSWGFVMSNLGFRRQILIRFDIVDLRNLKELFIGAIIADLIKKQKRQQLRAEQNKGSSFQPLEKVASFFPVANVALARILKISVYSAFKYKRKARDSGFIEIHNNKKLLKINKEELWMYRKAVDEQVARRTRFYRVNKNTYIIYTQEVDTVKSNVILANGKKNKSSIRVYKRPPLGGR